MMSKQITWRAYFTISGKRRMGVPVKINCKTMWIKVMIGAKSYIIIKRHLVKNNFKMVATEVM